MPNLPPPQGQFRTAGEFLRGLGPFLRHPFDTARSRERIVAHWRGREAAALRLFREAVFGNATSPYQQLLRHVGLGYDDIVALVRTAGVEGCLDQMYRAGVHVTLDEFKGRVPIRRGSLEIPSSTTMFDNRMLTASFNARTGGSRGAGRSLLIDLDLLEHEGCYERVTLTQFGVDGRERAVWRPVPPGTAGLKTMLRSAKAGLPVRRWFSQSPVWSREEWRHSLFTAATMMTSRVAGRPLARPVHVPVSDVMTIVDWLAAHVAAGRPGVLETNAASAVRVCQAAIDRRRSIAGTFFRVGGEPYTSGKAEVMARAGCQAVSHYSMSEVGRIANPCADPTSSDDAHVATDKVAILARDVSPAAASTVVPGLFLTTLHPSTSKIMINVELGDYAVLRPRTCGCAWNALGLTLHVEQIRSYEKLVSEGIHFFGAELLTLIEETLPRRFGGSALDYQLVETEEQGIPIVTLAVSPSVVGLDESLLRDTVVEVLGSGSASARMMAGRWREAHTLRVARREPYVTAAGKVLALHVPQGGRSHAS